EGGIDLTLFDRIGMEATYYTRKSTDALVQVPLPLSIGGGSRFDNIGSMKNWGYELTANADILNSDAVSWMVRLNWSKNNNELLTLGPDVQPTFGRHRSTSIVPGHPLYSFFE